VADTDNPPRLTWSDEDVPRSPLGHRLMFLLLVCLAFVLFAPTVVLPALREYCDVLAEEARLRERVGELEREIQRRKELAEAFAHDAVLNERLAMLDLHYQKPGEIVVPVVPSRPPAAEPPPSAAPADLHKLTIPESWPRWTHDAERWAHEHGLIALFLDSTFRPIVLLMSGGLLIAAFVLYAPKNLPTACSYPKGAQATASLPRAAGTMPPRPEEP